MNDSVSFDEETYTLTADILSEQVVLIKECFFNSHDVELPFNMFKTQEECFGFPLFLLSSYKDNVIGMCRSCTRPESLSVD